MKALLTIRRNVKEKELEALLSGEHDYCSCFIEVSPSEAQIVCFDLSEHGLLIRESFSLENLSYHCSLILYLSLLITSCPRINLLRTCHYKRNSSCLCLQSCFCKIDTDRLVIFCTGASWSWRY